MPFILRPIVIGVIAFSVFYGVFYVMWSVAGSWLILPTVFLLAPLGAASFIVGCLSLFVIYLEVNR